MKEEIVQLNASLPEHIELSTGSDDSVFIREAINSVYRTIAVTIVLVSLVILAFLGSLRTMAIPALTIPICLVSAFIALAAFGFTVNLITLLALVLSIGLVVDDAIVVLENIHRRIEEGEPPLVGGLQRHPPSGLRGDRHHRRAGGGIHPDPVPHRQHRRHLRRAGGDHRPRQWCSPAYWPCR